MSALHQVAIIGTAKHHGVSLNLADDSDRMLAALKSTDKEHQLLLRAGIGALHRQCGSRARTDVPRLEPAPASGKVLQSEAVVRLLQQSMNLGKRTLLLEFLRVLQDSKCTLPHQLLPEALELTDAEVRAALLPVLGPRGRWVSRYNPRWNWVQEEAGTLSGEDHIALQRAWNEGTLVQRVTALQVMRGCDPTQGRQWLEESLSQEKVDQRVRFITRLEVGLHLDDEPLLEKLLDDRSEQVRQIAAKLLVKLPGSQIAQRMLDRGKEILQAVQAGIAKKTLKLKCTVPEIILGDWMRDGIPAKAPHGQGRRAFWVESVLASINPTLWTAQFGAGPAELIEAINGDDYAEDVIAGWISALSLLRRNDPECGLWTNALWQYWSIQSSRSKGKLGQCLMDRLLRILQAMPALEAERAVQPLLCGETNAEALQVLLNAVPSPWSTGFSELYLAQARAVAKSKVIDRAYEWAKTMPLAAQALSPAAFAAALLPWDTARPGDTSWTANAIVQHVDQFLNTIRIRKTFYDELNRELNIHQA